MKQPSHSDQSDLARLQAVLDLYDNAPCGTLTFGGDGLILDINTTLSLWLGYDKDEVITKRTLPSFFKIGGQMFFETHFFPLIQLQGFIKEVYFDIIRKDKSIFRSLINVRSIPATETHDIIYQATILDVSDRWHYESELRKAKKKAEEDSKAKADFLATISHEIRTPLNSILGIGNLLHQTPLNDNQKEYARLLLHSSEHLLSLVNNLLDLSKIEANKIKLEHVVFNLHDVTTILKQTFSVRASEKGIALHMNMGKGVPKHIIGDPVKLKQILTNLIGNAIKFTKKGAVTLSISLLKKEQSKVFLHFKVTDTGIGIPKEKLEAIFQEFSQASYDVSVEFGGTGLGLTISKKLLELHESTLQVESTLHKGSSFSFDLWYEKSKRRVRDSKFVSAQDIPADFSSLKVLIVDDNPANIFIAAQYLDQWNITYETAESGQKALELIKQTTFDLLLLDLQMPVMNGYDTAKEIRTLALEKRPYIIAFSASTFGEVSDRIKEADIDDHLSKPFEPSQLYEVLLKNYKKKHSRKKKNIKLPRIRKIKTSVKQPKVETEENLVSSYTLTKYEKMANNNPVYLKKFVVSTLDALISYKSDFIQAIENKNSKDVSDLIHKSTMTLFYIQANRLTQLLKESCELVAKKDDPLLDAKVNECLTEFETIIQGLETV